MLLIDAAAGLPGVRRRRGAAEFETMLLRPSKSPRHGAADMHNPSKY